MLRTFAINSNKKCVKFWCFDSFLITKAIWDWGEFFGIHARSIPGQGVRIHYRRASGPHIRIGFAPGMCAAICTQLPPFAPRCALPFALGCRHLHPDVGAICTRLPCTSPRMFTSGILMPDRKGKRLTFSWRTYPDHLIASTWMGKHPFCTVLRCSPEAS